MSTSQLRLLAENALMLDLDRVLAICAYNKEDEYYVFACDEQYNVMGDTVHTKSVLMHETIQHDEEYYSPDNYLKIAREIFRDYHAECNVEIPKWFSEHRFDDYKERGNKIWRELFISYRDAFDVRNDNTIYVRTEILGKKTKREREEKKSTTTYRQRGF